LIDLLQLEAGRREDCGEFRRLDDIVGPSLQDLHPQVAHQNLFCFLSWRILISVQAQKQSCSEGHAYLALQFPSQIFAEKMVKIAQHNLT
jgi:hypothetical protein